MTPIGYVEVQQAIQADMPTALELTAARVQAELISGVPMVRVVLRVERVLDGYGKANHVLYGGFMPENQSGRAEALDPRNLNETDNMLPQGQERLPSPPAFETTLFETTPTHHSNHVQSNIQPLSEPSLIDITGLGRKEQRF